MNSTYDKIKVFQGATGTWAPPRQDGITVLVKVTNTRVVYGRPEFEVRPIAGSGSTWVNGHHLEIQKESMKGTR